MPRAFAKVNVAIWQDPDFRALPPAAQHLYLLLWTAPNLSFCGVHDWRPARLSSLSEGFTEEHTQLVADCLEARHFIVTDAETEEVLIRSWARFDEVLKQPRLAISYVNAYASTYSATLRSVLINEAIKMRSLWPELPCWKDIRVSSILEHDSVAAKDLPVPQDPFGDGFAPSLALGLGGVSPKADPRFGHSLGSVSVPPTTATTTTPSNGQTKRGDKSPATRKRAASLPDTFEPNDTNRRLAEERGLDLAAVLAQFLDHHRSKGSTFVDWHSALNTWIRREKAVPAKGVVRNLPHASELELPPDGLSETEYAEWERARRAR